MRNFWISSQIDGRSDLSSGPRGKNGAMVTNLYVKSSGLSVQAITIDCLPTEVGNFIRVYAEGEEIWAKLFTP